MKDAEVVPIKTKKLPEGASTRWENERQFTVEEVTALIKELDPKVRDLRVTEQIINHEGVLVTFYLRTPGNIYGYYYMLKGHHGPHDQSSVTTLQLIKYAGPDSEDVTGGETLAEYRNNEAWVKL